MKDLESKLDDKVRTITINRFKKIVKKYYRSEIFVGKKLVESVNIQNDIFRYSDNSAKSDINFKVLNKLKREDVTAIEKDIDFLDNLFSSTENEVGAVTQMKKYVLAKDVWHFFI